jgi:translocation and assembly module TamB
MPSITALEMGIDITPQRITVQRAQGDLGSAPFGLTGQLQLDAPEGIAVDLSLRGDNLLLYRSEGLKVRADADIGLTGPLSKLRIAGEVILTDSRLVQYLDVMRNLRGSGKSTRSGGFRLFSIDAAPLRDARFDIRLTAKAPFQLRNNLIKGALRPDLVLGGTGQLPVLTGKVYIEPTRVVLPSGNLTFESGVIHFDIENPDRPRLNLLGKSRLLGYDVSMLIEGPYDEPTVTLSSVPPLSNEELLLLVLTGQPPKTLDAAGGSRRRNVNVAVYIGRDFIARWFGQASVDAEESMLDRFNLEVGRGVTRSGDETIEAEFRLTENLLGQRDTVYLTGEKDVFDYYNAGVKVVFRFE